MAGTLSVNVLRPVGVIAGCTIALSGEAVAWANTQNPVLDVGIVQRFGSKSDDQVTLRALTGDRLTLRFKTGDEVKTLTTDTVKLEVVMEPQPEPVVQEWVVLSTHRSFESAEDSANQWRARGIETELAQPSQWQVWAKRDIYRTPLLRRLLLQDLEAAGFEAAFLDTQVKPKLPKAAFVANGYRYHRDRVDITTANQRIQLQLGDDRQNLQLYGGTMTVQPNAYGTYTLVNQVPIETYLRGVVPYEIGLNAPKTTIEAQAILARTYALRNLRRFTIDDYQLCADTQCQVYRGITGAAASTDQAIATTAGQVLTYQNELVDALYSSTTGGVTAQFSDVWNGPDRPYLRAVVDSVENSWNLEQRSLADEQNLRAFINKKEGFNEVGWKWFRWRTENTLDDIAKDLRKYLKSKQHPFANFKTVQQVQIVERANAGRVQKLAIQTDMGTVTLQKDEVLRALYGPNSLLFYIDPLYDTSAGASRKLKGYRFVGGGLGHAVGLSQTGAYRLGYLGWSSDRILSFYFPGTQLQPITNDLIFWRDPLTDQ